MDCWCKALSKHEASFNQKNLNANWPIIRQLYFNKNPYRQQKHAHTLLKNRKGNNDQVVVPFLFLVYLTAIYEKYIYIAKYICALSETVILHTQTCRNIQATYKQEKKNRKHSRCNGHCYRQWTQQPGFKYWMKLLALHKAGVRIQLFFHQLWVNSKTD